MKDTHEQQQSSKNSTSKTSEIPTNTKKTAKQFFNYLSKQGDVVVKCVY